MSETIRRLAEKLISEGAEDLPPRERRALERIAQRLSATRNWSADFDERLTIGQRVADQVAYWGGSWPFILFFAGVMVLWIGFNIAAAAQAFDPYPFILLNLVLSNYEVNLKAELEIMALHDKLDRARIEELGDAIRRIEAKLGMSQPPLQ